MALLSGRYTHYRRSLAAGSEEPAPRAACALESHRIHRQPDQNPGGAPSRV